MKFTLGRGIDKSDESNPSGNKKLLLAGGILIALLATSGGTYLIARDDSMPNSDVAGTVEIKRDACKQQSALVAIT